MKGSGGKKRTWSTNCFGGSFGEHGSASGNSFITSTDYVIPEVAKPACGGESSADEGFLDTPSTLLTDRGMFMFLCFLTPIDRASVWAGGGDSWWLADELIYRIIGIWMPFSRSFWTRFESCLRFFPFEAWPFGVLWVQDMDFFWFFFPQAPALRSHSVQF